MSPTTPTSTEPAPPSSQHRAPPVPQDPRLTAEFVRRLEIYMGGYDPASSTASMYFDWYASHAGERSTWFRADLLWRLETSRPIAGLRVLDFGCGTGSSAVVMAERGATVVGAETEPVTIATAIQRARDLGVSSRCSFVRIPYIQNGGASLPFRDGAFDLVTLIGVLEHMTHAERTDCAAEIRRVLEPGGELFIFDTPNRAYPFDFHTTRLWFVGWMPFGIARRYAVLRHRLEPDKDFGRRGGNGLSRRVIDRLFPAPLWQVTYEKKAQEVAGDFEWLGPRLVVLPRSWREGAGRLLRRACAPILRALDATGFRAAWWTSNHAVALRRMPDGEAS